MILMNKTLRMSSSSNDLLYSALVFTSIINLAQSYCNQIKKSDSHRY